MVQANELRIGNLLQDHNGKYHRMSIWLMQKMEEGLNQFEPIPLTPEILEKCGFLKDEFKNKVYNFISGRHGYFWFEIVQWNPINVSVWKRGAMNYGCFLTQISFLHQLQNLYFALTGEELNVQL